ALDHATLDAAITGDITVVAGTGVTLMGGNLTGSGSNYGVSDVYAQIGNGGAHAFQNASVTGPGAYALISSNINVTAVTSDILLQGGSVNPAPGNIGGYGLTLKDAYAQIGNGGNYAFQHATLTGTGLSGISGNIGVTAVAGNITLAGGNL